jgi:hypothetical protein
MHGAINAGKFSGVINHSFLEPMLPFMETLQKSIVGHFESLLCPSPSVAPSPGSTRKGATKLAKYEVVSRFVFI